MKKKGWRPTLGEKKWTARRGAYEQKIKNLFKAFLWFDYNRFFNHVH